MGPRESFNAILNITKEKAIDFAQIIDQLEGIHVCNKNTSGPQKKLVWFLEKGDDIKAKCSEVLRQSREELSIITTGDGLEVVFNSAHRLLDEIHEKGVEIKIYSPLDPKANSLARELSYIFEVKKVEVLTPILFINSDNSRFLLSKLAPRGSELPFESAIFSEDKDLLRLLHLLLGNSNKKTLRQVFPM